MLRQILRIALKSAEESKQETSLGLKKKVLKMNTLDVSKYRGSQPFQRCNPIFWLKILVTPFYYQRKEGFCTQNKTAIINCFKTFYNREKNQHYSTLC